MDLKTFLSSEKSLFKGIFVTIIGTVALIGLAALSFWATEQAITSIKIFEPTEWVLYGFAGIVVAGCYLVL